MKGLFQRWRGVEAGVAIIEQGGTVHRRRRGCEPKLTRNFPAKLRLNASDIKLMSRSTRGSSMRRQDRGASLDTKRDISKQLEVGAQLAQLEWET